MRIDLHPDNPRARRMALRAELQRQTKLNEAGTPELFIVEFNSLRDQLQELERKANVVELVIPRISAYEHTFAVVIVETATLVGSTQVREALERALCDWMTDTPEGKRAWENSSEKYNIGDLEHDAGCESMLFFLRQQGILHLQVKCFSTDNNGWQYDDEIGCPDLDMDRKAK